MVDADHIYWPHFGDIGRANLDGTGIDPSFISASPLPFVGAMVVDADHIYWRAPVRSPAPTSTAPASTGASSPTPRLRTSRSTPSTSIGARRCSASLGPARGRSPGLTSTARASTTASSILGDSAVGLAVDEGHIYWGALDGIYGRAIGRIGRANLDGTSIDPASSPAQITSRMSRSAPITSTGHMSFFSQEDCQRTSHRPRQPRRHRRRSGLRPPCAALAALPCGRQPHRHRARGQGHRGKDPEANGKKILVKVKMKANEQLTAEATRQDQGQSDLQAKAEEGHARGGRDQDAEAEAEEGKGEEDRQGAEAGRDGEGQGTVKLTDAPGTARPRSCG